MYFRHEGTKARRLDNAYGDMVPFVDGPLTVRQASCDVCAGFIYIPNSSIVFSKADMSVGNKKKINKMPFRMNI